MIGSKISADHHYVFAQAAGYIGAANSATLVIFDCRQRAESTALAKLSAEVSKREGQGTLALLRVIDRTTPQEVPSHKL